ncbi:hypothetical protein CAPTEDRAFT_202009, partial [Capitella teleta]
MIWKCTNLVTSWGARTEKYVRGTGFFDEAGFEESEQSVMLKYRGVVGTLKTLRRRGVFELFVFELAGFYCMWICKENATKDEINNAFRRMSRLYHPDKHANRPGLNEKAVNLFTKIKKAHEVLSDPQKRAIYDAVGIKGLELTGLE